MKLASARTWKLAHTFAFRARALLGSSRSYALVAIKYRHCCCSYAAPALEHVEWPAHAPIKCIKISPQRSFGEGLVMAAESKVHARCD